MKIHDISVPISPGLVVWPKELPVELKRVSSLDKGAPVNASWLATGVHCGTHVDAPHHFVNDRRTVEALPLDVLTGSAQVVRIPDEATVVTAILVE